jgi:hypothetical protein
MLHDAFNDSSISAIVLVAAVAICTNQISYRMVQKLLLGGGKGHLLSLF